MTNLVDEIMVFDPRECSKCRFSRRIKLDIDVTYLAKSSFSASAIASSLTINLDVAILETHYLQ